MLSPCLSLCLVVLPLGQPAATPVKPTYGLPYELGVEDPEPEAIAAMSELSAPPVYLPWPGVDPVWNLVQGASLLNQTVTDLRLRHRGKISASGGEYFAEPVLFEVPHFFQHDTRWAAEPLGPTNSTLGREGCAVACSAMLLNFYGADTDPSRLNTFLIAHPRGYTKNGWLWWEDAADLTGQAIVHAYESKPSYHLIDANLKNGNPVIARVTFPSGVTHFVIIVGKEGYDYLASDPGMGGEKGVYPLREIGLPIDGLRFYVPTGLPVEQPPETKIATAKPVKQGEAVADPTEDAMPQKPLAPAAHTGEVIP